jgi:hypothetical protein
MLNAFAGEISGIGAKCVRVPSCPLKLSDAIQVKPDIIVEGEHSQK